MQTKLYGAFKLKVEILNMACINIYMVSLNVTVCHMVYEPMLLCVQFLSIGRNFRKRIARHTY